MPDTYRTHIQRLRRHQRIRKRIRGTSERPRLAVFRSNRHIYAQIIDDSSGRTLAAAATVAPGLPAGANVSTAAEVGRAIAERAKAAGVTSVVFDRGGYLYHGKVASLADAARETGLEF